MQQSIVAIIVVYAFWVVAKRYAPQSVLRFARSGIARTARRFGWRGMASRFETVKPPAPSCGDGCASCRRCGANEAAPAIKSFSISPELINRSRGRSKKSVEQE